MIKFFRKIRQRLLQENKIKRYLVYAIGEIILVMVGILLALQVNNWNDERKKSNQLKALHERIVVDLSSDIADLQYKIDFWEYKKPLFDSIRIKGFTEQLLEQGAHKLASVNPLTTLNMSGINQLKALQNKDSLTLKIISAYEHLVTHTLNNEQEALENMYDRRKLLQKYDWYRDYLLNDLECKEAKDYILNNSEYVNNLLWSYNRIYSNYLPSIYRTLPTLKEARKQLRVKIDPEFKPLTKEMLQDYTGDYILDEDMENALPITSKDTLRLTTYKDMLETDFGDRKYRFIDDFSKNKDLFINANDYNKSIMQFERDKDSNIQKLRYILEYNGKIYNIWHLKKVSDKGRPY